MGKGRETKSNIKGAEASFHILGGQEKLSKTEASRKRDLNQFYKMLIICREKLLKRKSNWQEERA